MEFKEKFRFVKDRLETLMSFREISGHAYIAISIELLRVLRVEDDWGLTNVMDMMESAVLDEQDKKDREKKERDEAKRKREEERKSR